MILLFTFGYGVTLDATDVPVAMVVENPSATTASFTGAFSHSHYFHTSSVFLHAGGGSRFEGPGGGWDHLAEKRFSAGAVLSGDTAAIGVYVNGVDANNARLISGYVQGVWGNWLTDFAASQGRELKNPVDLQFRILYNPGGAEAVIIWFPA